VRRTTGVLALVLASAVASVAPQDPAASSGALILVTLDGARVEEMFGGLDIEVLRSTLRDRQVLEEHPLYQRFYAATPEERRRKLMPFFWDELMVRHGSIAGNPRLNSSVTLTNRHRFSYPGYSEILVGQAHDDVIASNSRVYNPHVTLLEGLRARLGLPASQVAVFGSWEVFNEIVQRAPGAVTVNAGYARVDDPDPGLRELADLQFHTPTPWDSVRHDVYTFRLAMAHLERARPRILYLALGETDDWAHDGRYDRVLETYARTDGYLRELWEWLQAQPDYAGRVHLLLTTDHGRGRTPDDWRSHGAKVQGAEDVWIAFVSPRVPARGEWRGHPPLFTSQIAATLASWVGIDWTEFHPGAGPPIR
jgi:hypothetical protein